jgi:hypothetical protein
MKSIGFKTGSNGLLVALSTAAILGSISLTITPAAAAADAKSAGSQDAVSDGRDAVEKEISAHLRQARLEAIDKKYQEALDGYLWVFENSRNLKKWQGVRNAIVSQELVKLAEAYPPAKAEILKLRDNREKLIVDNKAVCADVQDWAILDHNLSDDRHSVSVYKQLSARGASTDKICDWIEDCIPVSLVRAREYKELLPWAERTSAEHINTVQESEKNGFTGRLALPLVLEDVYACYEVLLAEGKQKEADDLAQCILRPWSSHDMFSAFVRAAKRTNHPEVADALLAQARKKVSATDYELIMGEIKPIGESK